MKKTVLITGASSGIGHAAAHLFAHNGWNVVATMRHPDMEADLARLPNVTVTRLDVRDLASIEQAIETALVCYEKVDVLVNNAGYGQYGLFEAIPRKKIQEQFEVNVFGLMDVTRALLPHFRKNKSGTIINISSGAGIYTLPMISLYCASKFALEGFSEALSYELASQNITVKIVEPHGGVSNTSFNETTARELAKGDDLSDYNAFIAQTQEDFAQMNAARTTTAQEVAKTIYEAATDGTDRLRYLVGDDARGFMKSKQTVPDADYVAFMRSHFRPK